VRPLVAVVGARARAAGIGSGGRWRRRGAHVGALPCGAAGGGARAHATAGLLRRPVLLGRRRLLLDDDRRIGRDQRRIQRIDRLDLRLAAEAARWVAGATEPPGVADDLLGEPPPLDILGTARDRLVVVDDNADLRDYLRRLLSPRWNLDLAADGTTGLDMIRRLRPAIVLTCGTCRTPRFATACSCSSTAASRGTSSLGGCSSPTRARSGPATTRRSSRRGERARHARHRCRAVEAPSGKSPPPRCRICQRSTADTQ
jgi:hypothetical protein